MKMMKKIASLAMALCVVAFVACSGGKTPTGVVEKYLGSLKSENYDKAIDCMDVDQSQEKELKEFRAKMEAAMVQAQGLKSYEVLSETIAEDGETASVEAKVVWGNEKEDEQTFNLKKIEGEWKIDLKSK